MSIGAVAAIYLTVWCIALLVAVLWSTWRRPRNSIGADGKMGLRPSLLPMVLGTTFIATLVTGAVAYLFVIGG